MISFGEFLVEFKGLARKDMPQIASDDFDDFIKENGLKYAKSKIKVKDLTPIQKEINVEKAESMLKTLDKTINKKPMIISSDDFVLDGHHRYLAAMMTDKNMVIPVWRVNVTMSKLLKIAKKSKYAEYRDINTFKK